MGYTEKDLDRMINEVLDEYKEYRGLPYIYGMINSTRGRKRIFEFVKRMVLEQGMTDIEAILTQIQCAQDWPPQD